jgi:hypothetical protein
MAVTHLLLEDGIDNFFFRFLLHTCKCFVPSVPETSELFPVWIVRLHLNRHEVGHIVDYASILISAVIVIDQLK